MEKIAVLMSTYNGEKYIREQIESILAQTGVVLTLIIRDDGSTDGTKEIIHEYMEKSDNIILINETGNINLGFNKSFFALIDYAITNVKDTELFAFADQDDVWMSDKLKSAIKVIDEMAKPEGGIKGKPIYYYANKYWCDGELHVLHEDTMKYCLNDYFDMFMLPPVYGCTSVFNRSLGIKTLEEIPDEKLLYDVYMFRLACMTGGIVIGDKTPHMYYRRHGDNASGDAMSLSPIKHFRKLLRHQAFHGIYNYTKEIYTLHKDDIVLEQKKLCELILNYQNSFLSRLKLLFWKKAYGRGLKAALIWIGRVVTSSI